jgi:glyoxalase family protein
LLKRRAPLSTYPSPVVVQAKGGDNAQDPEPGRAPHHAGRRRPADLHRLLGGAARDAVRLRAAESDDDSESHLYFDPGDGRLITVFTREDRRPDGRRTPRDPGCVHHLALSVSHTTFRQIAERLDERGVRHSGPKDRGFMDSIYFTDPLGFLIELAAYRFEPPEGATHGEVLLEAHKIRVGRGDRAIDQVHVADAIEALTARRRESLSEDRGPRDPYRR